MKGTIINAPKLLVLDRSRFFGATRLQFLYQTRTILARPLRAFRNIAGWQIRPISTTQTLCETHSTSNASNRSSTNPFLDILGEDKRQKSVTDRLDPPPALSTLTGAEREIFQRLLLATPARVEGEDSSNDLDISRGQEAEGLEDQDTALYALLDDALEGLDLSEEFPQEEREVDQDEEGPRRYINEVRADFESFKGIERFDLSLSRKYGKMSRTTGVPVAPISTTLSSRIGASQPLQADFRRLADLFSQAKTDTDIWHVLNRSIFGKMRHVNTYLETAAKEREPVAMAAVPAHHTGRQAQSRDQNMLGGDVRQRDSRSRVALSKTSPIRIPDHYLPALNVYGPASLYGLRLLRARYPQSPWALHVLPTIKTLGAMSYVLAASTDLYNELLYIKWVYYRDLNGCAALLEEMMSRDLYADRRTILVWAEADSTRRNETRIESSFPAAGAQLVLNPIDSTTGAKTRQYVATTRFPKSERAGAGTSVSSLAAGWWRLEGVQVGWNRWTAAKDEAIQRLRTRNGILKKLELEERLKKEEEAIAERRGESDVEPDVFIVEPRPSQRDMSASSMHA